jgi:hypothetical protein
MPFQQIVVVFRIGEREAARLALFLQDVDVLSGQELQTLVGGQFKVQRHHIFGQSHHLFHAARQSLDDDFLRGGDFVAFDRQVR